MSKRDNLNTSICSKITLSCYDNNLEDFHNFASSDIEKVEVEMFQGHLLVKVTSIIGGVAIYPSVESISMGVLGTRRPLT